MSTNSEDSPKRLPGRPRGSGRSNGFQLHKMTKTEVELFLKESTKKVFRDHLSHTEYVEWCRKQSISYAQANKYWLRVWEQVREKFRMDKDKLIDKHLRSYWEIHHEAMVSNDLTNARQTLDAIAKLMGLNEPDKVDMTTEIKLKFNFGDEPDENTN